jgi:hypothetical protein
MFGPMRRKLVILVGLAAFAVLAGVSYMHLRWPNRANRAIVRNDCSNELQDVELVLRDYPRGTEFARKQIARLRGGESAVLRHGRTDLSADLRFTLAGRDYSYTQSYIDLWMGEGWIFAVQSDGRVLTGYDYEGFNVSEPMESLASRPASQSVAKP